MAVDRTASYKGRMIRFAMGTMENLEELKAREDTDIYEVKTYIDMESGKLLIVPIDWDKDDIRYNYKIKLD